MFDSSDDHQYMIDRAQWLAGTFAPRAAHWDQSREYCWDNVNALQQAGLMGMTIPKEYGGSGASYLTALKVVEEIAKACTLSARIVVEANMGGISAIMTYGTDSQKRFCAPIVLAGDKPAICITEPDAGSTATEMTTTARLLKNASGERYILNGTKHWITGGGISKLHRVFARVINENNNDLGIGGFIVHRDPDRGINPSGLTIGPREQTMGL